MRFLLRVVSLFSFGAICIAAYTNLSSVDHDVKNAKSKDALPIQADDETKPEKEYVLISGKYYEKNARGVYNVDGVPTMVKSAPVRREVAAKPKEENSNLGPKIELEVYKDAMGLDAKDEFFRPKAGDSSDESRE
ncbi:MAG: hypothetical protein ACXVA9_04305 [Bdellovibrionales bacterium]